jgi:threonine dehydrogenase-like Zn-dependent dehydrogenase
MPTDDLPTMHRVRAAVTDVDGTTSVRSLPIPTIGDDDALIAVEASGICGTDVKLARERQLAAPTILGHHVVGRVRAIGVEASRSWSVDVGDLVAVQEYLPCRSCRWCKQGEFRMCPTSDFRTGGRRVGTVSVAETPSLWGGNAELLYLPPESIVHRLPQGVGISQAVWLLPLANAFDWTVESGGAEDGCTVVIVGPGQHGLACVVAAREVGASNIVVVGRPGDGDRLSLAEKLGGHQVIAEPAENLASVRELLGSDRADVVVNTSGAGPEFTARLVDLVGKRGTLVEAGVVSGRVAVDLGALTARAMRIIGCRGRSLSAVDRAMASLDVPGSTHPLELVPSRAVGLSQIQAVLSGDAPDDAAPDAHGRAVHTIVIPNLDQEST